MAWWNKPAGSLTPSVTLDRIAAWFVASSYTYTVDHSEEAIYSGFDGIDYRFKMAGDRLLSLHGRYLTGLPTDEETVARVRLVARQVAESRVVPAVYLVVDEYGLGLHAETVSAVGAGLNDEQLSGTIDFCLGGTDGAIREILETLGLDAPGSSASPETEPTP